MTSIQGIHRSVLESETKSGKDKRTDDRRRTRIKLKEKLSQVSTSRVTYKDRIAAIRLPSSRNIQERDPSDDPASSTRKVKRELEPGSTRMSYAEAVKAGRSSSQDEVVEQTNSAGKRSDIRNR